MQVLVDLSRCQSYGQCVYAAPDVFRLAHEEVLEWEYSPDDAQHERVVRAAAHCPVQAVTYGPTRATLGGAPTDGGPADGGPAA